MFLCLGLAAALAAAAPARADEWKVTQLDGEARIERSGHWKTLSRNDVVSDAAPIRTFSASFVQLERDHEKILLLADTQAHIVERPGNRYTTVTEEFGTVGVEATPSDAPHFEVRNAFLAVTSAGGIFAVGVEPPAAMAAVNRGSVEVFDSAHNAKLEAGGGKAVVGGKGQRAVLKNAPTPDSALGFEADVVQAARILVAQTEPPTEPSKPLDAAARPAPASTKIVEATRVGAAHPADIRPDVRSDLRGALVPEAPQISVDRKPPEPRAAAAGAAAAAPDKTSPKLASPQAPAPGAGKTEATEPKPPARGAEGAPRASDAGAGPAPAAASGADKDKPSPKAASAEAARAPDGKSGPQATSPAASAAAPLPAPTKTPPQDVASDAAAAQVSTAPAQATAAAGGAEPDAVSPDQIRAGLAAAGMKPGKVTPKQMAQGMQTVGVVAQAVAPHMVQETPPAEHTHMAVASGLFALVMDQEVSTISLVVVVLIAAFVGVGGLLNVILGDVGFGGALNGLIAMTGALLGAGIRDLFFFDEFWFGFEPYVSVGILTISGSCAILGCCALRFRARLRDEQGPAPARTASWEKRLARHRAVR